MSKFSKIGAKKTTSAAKASDRPVIAVTDKITKAVDTFIATKAEIKKLEAEMKEAATTIKEHARSHYVELGFTNQFTKSLDVPGTGDARLVCTHTDRFSVPQDEETLELLKKLIGKRYDEFFTTKESISIRKEVLENEKLLDKVATACEKAGLEIATIFERSEKVTAIDSLDQKQFTLDRAKFDQFATLVKQADAGLK
jgi:hypothetical protein